MQLSRLLRAESNNAAVTRRAALNAAQRAIAAIAAVCAPPRASHGKLAVSGEQVQKAAAASRAPVVAAQISATTPQESDRDTN